MSHRDRSDLGTHLSRGENRGSYVRATDLHLSLRSFRDNYSQSTLPLWNEFVNEPAKLAHTHLRDLRRLRQAAGR